MRRNTMAFARNQSSSQAAKDGCIEIQNCGEGGEKCHFAGFEVTGRDCLKVFSTVGNTALVYFRT